jgi:hypothetical protein
MIQPLELDNDLGRNSGEQLLHAPDDAQVDARRAANR